MSNIKKKLIELNPELFKDRQPSLEYEIFVVGEKDKDGKFIYLRKTKPNAKAIKAGIRSQNFIHCAVRPVNTITIEGSKRSYSGPKRSQVDNVFQNVSPYLYQFIKEALVNEKNEMLEEGETYVKAGFDALKRPMLKLRDTLWGRKVIFNSDLYKPHSMDETGEMKAFQATTYNPKTGQYEKKDVVRGAYQFFADDEDLDTLLETCMRHWNRNITPFVTEKVTTVTEKAGKTTTEITEAEVTSTEDYVFDADGNAVDENGEIYMTAEDLAKEGIAGNEGETVKLKKVS